MVCRGKGQIFDFVGMRFCSLRRAATSGAARVALPEEHSESKPDRQARRGMWPGLHFPSPEQGPLKTVSVGIGMPASIQVRRAVFWIRSTNKARVSKAGGALGATMQFWLVKKTYIHFVSTFGNPQTGCFVVHPSKPTQQGCP